MVTWGNSDDGGDSSAVVSKLDGTVDVMQIFSTGSAFAALRADGSVVTWGNSDDGGDSSAVADKLSSGVASIADVTTELRVAEANPPAFSSASVEGNTLTIKYNEATGLDTQKTAPNSAFSVLVNGHADNILSVSAYSSNQVMLSLATPVTAGQTVSVSYTDPTSNNDNYAVQDLFGNDAVSITNQAVTLVGVSAGH